MFKKCVSFDDVLLLPRMSDISSRSEISLSSSLSGIELSLPIISSPMDTVTESEMASAMGNLGGLGIIHRYNTISEQASIVREVASLGSLNIGASFNRKRSCFARKFKYRSSHWCLR